MKKILLIVISCCFTGLIVGSVTTANTDTVSLESHKDSLITLQDSLIKELEDHCWNEHDCDLPMLDGDIVYDINEQKTIINNLKK